MTGMFIAALRSGWPGDVARRSAIISAICLLTLIDLFEVQAPLPQIAKACGTGAATAFTAVNAATLCIAVPGRLVARFADRIDRARSIWISLVNRCAAIA